MVKWMNYVVIYVICISLAVTSTALTLTSPSSLFAAVAPILVSSVIKYSISFWQLIISDLAANDIRLNYHLNYQEIMLRILTLVISSHPLPPSPHSNPALWSLSFSWNVWKYVESSTRISGWAHFQTFGSTLNFLQSVPDVSTPSIFVNNAGSKVQTHPHPHHLKVYTSSHYVSYSFSHHVSIHHQ